jgi:pilus assembly protein Flp/PilA
MMTTPRHEAPDGKDAMLNRFWADETGATAIEYGLIAALIAVAIIAGATVLSVNLNTAFVDISTRIKGK